MTDNKKFVPPVSVKNNAQKGLDLREKFKRGGTRVGVTRAHQLAKREELSADIVKRMSSYFARHKVDKQAADFGNDDDPSKGYIAWLLWGGDEGKEWADDKKKEINEKK